MGLLDEAVEVVACVSEARGAKSFVPSTQVDIPADPTAQSTWADYNAALQAGKLPVMQPARVAVVVKCQQMPSPREWAANPDAHIAFWVYRFDGTVWRHWVSLTDAVDVDLPWDGLAMSLKITVATSIACDLGVSAFLIPPTLTPVPRIVPG